MYCPQCGMDNDDEVKFCRSCGSDLSLVPAAVAGKIPRRQWGAVWTVMAVLYFLFGLMGLIMPLLEPTDMWANDLLRMTGGISLISAAIMTMVFQYERFIIPILKKEGSRFLAGATMLLVALVTVFLSRAGVLPPYTSLPLVLLMSGIFLFSTGLVFGAMDVVRGRRKIDDSARAVTSPLSDPLNKELPSRDYLEISEMQSATEKTTELLEDRDKEKQ